MFPVNGVAPSIVVAKGPARTPGLRALFPFSNHKDYCLATLKIWGHCGICTLVTSFRQEERAGHKKRRKLAPMLGEGVHSSRLTGCDGIPHKVAMAGTGKARFVINRGSTRASTRCPHAATY
jgi:hypothetical protein